MGEQERSKGFMVIYKAQVAVHSINTSIRLHYIPKITFQSGSQVLNTLLKSDVTSRDHVSVVMDAGSCIVNFIVNFIRDGTVFAFNSEILVRMRISPCEPARHDNGASDVWALTAYRG